MSITRCECWLPPDTLLAVIRTQPWHGVTCSDSLRPLWSSAVNNIWNSWFYRHWKLSDWSASRQNWQLPKANKAKLLQVYTDFYTILSFVTFPWSYQSRGKFWIESSDDECDSKVFVCVCSVSGKVAIFPNPINQIRLVDKSPGLSGAHERYAGSGDGTKRECTESHFS